jgi:small subunit ribosomal protein S2e
MEGGQREGGGDRGGGDRGDRGRGFGGRGRGGRDRPGGGGRGGPPKDEWFPKTKLGRLVKGDYIKSLEEIYTHSIPIKESQIVDKLIEGSEHKLQDDVMKIISVQKQTTAGQRTRFKAIVAIGDMAGHLGLGIKVAKEVQIAIKGALIDAKLNLVPVRRGYWGNKIGHVHTVPGKVTGKCASVRVKLVPAPRGTGIVGAPVSKKMITFAGIEDCYTQTSGHTRTAENFLKATYQALQRTYQYLSPDLWPKTLSVESHYAKHAEWLQIQAEKKPVAPRGGDRDRGRGRGGRGRGDGRGGRGRGGGRGGPRGGRD